MSAALHVSSGDATDQPGTGRVERVLYRRDVLHEGPVPEVGPEGLRRIRAAFLLQAGRDDGAAALLPRGTAPGSPSRGYMRAVVRSGPLRPAPDHPDPCPPRRARRARAAHHLDLYRPARGHGPLRWSRLTAEQLRELPATNAYARLTPAAVQLATRAWAASRSPTPDGLRAIAGTRSGELRFPGEAFDRLGREYPAVRDGPSLSGRRIPVVGADGATDAESAFARVAARETRPFLGDSWRFAMTDRTAHEPVPRLPAEPTARPVGTGTGLRPTDTGPRVLAGAADQRTRRRSTASTGGPAGCTCADATCRGAGTTEPKPSSARPRRRGSRTTPPHDGGRARCGSLTRPPRHRAAVHGMRSRCVPAVRDTGLPAGRHSAGARALGRGSHPGIAYAGPGPGRRTVGPAHRPARAGRCLSNHMTTRVR